MLDTDARVAAVNGRVARLRRRKEQRVNAALSASCMVLCLGLVGVIGLLSEQPSPVAVHGLFASSSLLGSEAGGYVLVALVSFFLAVVITLLCLRRKRADRDGAKRDFAQVADGQKGDER